MALLLVSLLPVTVEAQPWPEPNPTPEIPDIKIDTIAFNTATGEKYGNYFRFSLKWPQDTSVVDTLHNPPDPINEEQDSLARWVYFWKFGDNTYSADTSPIHAFAYNTGTGATMREYDVEVSLKPIYSDDHDPFKKKRKKKVGIPPKQDIQSSTPPMQNINYNMITEQGAAIELQANWRATRPGKGLTMAITYRALVEGPVSGVVGFLCADDIVSIVEGVEGAPGDGRGEEMTVGPNEQTSYPLRGFKWHFSNLTPSMGERTIFLDVEVSGNAGQLINDTSSVQRPVYAFIAYNDPKSGNPSKPLSLGDLFGTSKSADNDQGVATSSENYNFTQGVREMMTINWAADPNYILVSPEYLEPGTVDQTLEYSVHFQNDGASSATKLDVHIAKDPLLYGAGINPVDTKSVPLCLKFATVDSIIKWATPPPPKPMTPTWPGTCKLNGAGDAVALGFSTNATWGEVHYDIRTDRFRPLQIGDTIRAYGTVYMNNRGEATPVTVVPVGIPAFCYPGILGLKYTQHFANDAIRSGWGLGLSLRYGLGKVQNPNFEAHSLRRIRKNNFPLFWWQGELGYGQTSLQLGADDLRLCHLDLSPLTLRFIAKKPALPLGGLVVQRGWGISAGYTASYLLASRRNGADDIAFDQFGFGDRLDHSISLSADFLNLIGRPGISIGAGWRWRNSGITGTREWYQNAFVYLHYTFSPRFRTEFGWLK